jgi:hypothetical protein
MDLKPNCAKEFTKKLETNVLPLLRKQKGFKDEITFVATGGKDAFGISLWDHSDNVDEYNRGTYPEIMKMLDGVVEGKPRVETYEVSNSTFHKIAAAITA